MLNELRESAVYRMFAQPQLKSFTVILFVLTTLLSGCSGTMLTSYTSKMNPIIAPLKTGTPVNFDQLLVDESTGSDLILYNMELGRIAQLLGKAEPSMKSYARSIEKVHANEQKATVSASKVSDNVLSIISNDNAISYEGEGYEQVLLHHYQALNFLGKKDLEGAGVEVRRANSKQVEALKAFEAEVEKAQKDAKAKKVDKSSFNPIDKQYAQLDEIAGKVKNSFQNAYTFYVSGFVYELLNQSNDAYIDYKKALEIYPENIYIQKDVMRLAASLGMNEDLDAFKARFKSTAALKSKNVEGGGDLLVIYEDGLAPQKQQVKISLPIPNAGIVSIAFPIYKEKWTQQSTATVSAGGELLGTTAPICDIRALAVKALKEKVPVMATRQIIRAVAKGVSNKLAKDHLGIVGELGMSVLNTATENADLRSWITLPSNAQVLRSKLPAGKHKITVKADNLVSTNAIIEIPENGKALLLVSKTGNQIYTKATTF